MQDLSDVEILIVEDNPNDAEMALRAFKRNNIANSILVVEDGEEALNFIFGKGRYSGKQKSCRPKIILLDLKLPKIDGLEVLREIKGDENTKIIPVVVLTTSKEETDIVESYKLGVNSYIVKPVDFEKFVQSVKDIGMYWLLLNELP